MNRYLLIFLLLFRNHTATAQVMHNNIDYRKTLKFNNNYFRFAQPLGFMIIGKMCYSNAVPISVNGKRIYNSDSVAKAPKFKGEGSLDEYIGNKLKPILAALPDGKYLLETFSLTVDEQGKLIYFDFTELRDFSNAISIEAASTQEQLNNKIRAARAEQKDAPVRMPIPATLQKKITHALYEALVQAPVFTPAKLASGEAVNCYLDMCCDFDDFIIIKDHEVSFEPQIHHSPGRK